MNQLYFIKKILELETEDSGICFKGHGHPCGNLTNGPIPKHAQLRVNWTQPQDQGHPGSKG